uniref:Uncharacterized protein n=1 Tax=Rhizophora mucronata TaxID=61149 RepID=A0A2P2NYF4_RHIMU
MSNHNKMLLIIHLNIFYSGNGEQGLMFGIEKDSR